MSAIEIIMCVATVGMFVSNVLSNVFQNRKQRNEVSYAFVPAAKQDFDKHLERNKIEHDLLADKIIAARREIDIHLSSRTKTIFDKIDQTANAQRLEMVLQTNRRDETIEKLRTDLESKMEDNRAELSERISAMPNEVVALLKNTGAI